MANIVGLALRVTGDASGLARSLTPVDRALEKLAAQAEKATNVFTPFAEKTAAAGRAQEEFAAKFSALADQLRANLIGPQEYAAAFGRLTEEAKGTAAAFQEGLRITQQNQTAEQARTSGLERLNELLRLGAIDARNFGLEAAKLSEGSDSTALDRFAEAVAPLRAALEGGTLSAERFAEQSQEIAAAISGSTPAAERQATAILELRNRFEAGRVSIEQYREEFSRIQSGDIATTFEVQVVGVREGVEASNELRASLAQLTDTQITAALQVAGVEKLDDLRQQFAGIDGAQIDAVLKVLGVETIEEARQQLESLANVDASATVSIANAAEVQNTIRLLESSFGSLEAAQSRLESLPDVDLKATLEVLGVDSIDAARERLIALGALQIEPKLQAIGFENIDAAQSAIDSLSDRSVTATLEFLGAGDISDAAEKLATLDGATVEAFLQATGFDSIDAAQAKLGELKDVDVAATLQLLGVDTIDAARNRLVALGEIQIQPKLQAIGFDSIDAARTALESLSDRSITATLDFLGTQSLEDARERLGTLDGTTVEAFLRASGFESIDAAQAKLGELQDVDVTATLQLLGVDTIDAARDRLSQLGDLQVEPRLQAIGFESIDAARAAIDSLGDRSITATLEFLGTDSIDDARERLGVLDGTTVEAFLRASGFESIDAAQEKLAELQSVDVAATLTVLGVDTIDEARQRLASLSTVDIEPVLRLLGVDSIADAQQQLAAVNGTEIDTQLRVLGIDGIESARTLIASVEGKNVDLIAKTFGIDSVASLTQAIDAAESKTVTFDVASNANEEADRIAGLVAEQERYKAATAEGLKMTERFRTAQERLAVELARIDSLLSQNAISEETANRAREAAVADAERNNGNLERSLSRLDESLNVVEARASGVARIFGSVGDSFNSVSGIAEGIGNAVRSVSEAGSAVIQFGADIAKATIAFKAFRFVTDNYSVPSGLLGVVLNLSKFLAVIKVAEVAAKQFGIDISGVAEATTKASLVFAGFKIGGLLGLDKAIAPLVATLGTALPAALARLGVPLAASSAASTVLSTTLTRLLAFSIPGFGQLAAATYTTTRAFLASRDTLNQLSAAVAKSNDEARRLGATFQDLQVQLLLDTGKTRAEIAQFGLALNAIDIRQLDDLAFANERAAQSSENLQSGLAAFGATIAKVFTGALAGLTDGVGRVTGGFADLVAGINAIADPIAGVLRPFFTLIGTGVQAIFGLVGAFESAVGATLRFVGVISKIVLSPVIVGFNNFADTVQRTVGNALGYVASLADAVQSKITQLQEFLSSIPVIGEAFASAQGGVVKQVSDQVSNAAASTQSLAAAVSQLSEEELREADSRQKLVDQFTESVSKAIDESVKFGQAGFNAALQYQESIDELKEKLAAGLFNEETFRREAARAGEVFKSELARIEEDAKLDIQISEETQRTLNGLQDKINEVAEDATRFGQSGFDAAARFQAKLRELGQQFEDGRINAASLAAETAKATAEYDKQIAGFTAIDELQKSILKADQDRVAALLAQNNATTELEQNQAAVQREQLRLGEEIRRQREAGNVFAADAAAARLAQLDQEAAKLEDIQQATDQGFTEGFQKSFQATAKSIDDLSRKAEQFGNVGALAAEALRLGVERAQLQARDGILTQETYDQEIARQQNLFDQRLAAAQRVEDFLANAFGQRNKAELDAVAKLEERKKQAEVNVQAIQAQINTEQLKRDATTNLGERRAATQRIAALRQAERIESGIAKGRNDVALNQASGLAGGFRQAEQFQSRIAQTNDNFLRAFSGTYAQASASLNAANAVAAELARQQELSRPVAGSVSTADIRTAEGAALVLGLGAAAQDPALIEARLQTKQLAGIRTAINNAVTGYIGTVAEIF